MISPSHISEHLRRNILTFHVCNTYMWRLLETSLCKLYKFLLTKNLWEASNWTKGSFHGQKYLFYAIKAVRRGEQFSLLKKTTWTLPVRRYLKKFPGTLLVLFPRFQESSTPTLPESYFGNKKTFFHHCSPRTRFVLLSNNRNKRWDLLMFCMLVWLGFFLHFMFLRLEHVSLCGMQSAAIDLI